MFDRRFSLALGEAERERERDMFRIFGRRWGGMIICPVFRFGERETFLFPLLSLSLCIVELLSRVFFSKVVDS